MHESRIVLHVHRRNLSYRSIVRRQAIAVPSVLHIVGMPVSGLLIGRRPGGWGHRRMPVRYLPKEAVR